MDRIESKRRSAVKKPKRPRVFEEVLNHIREDLRTGVLKSGDRLLSERDLAAQFGVSRPAVREALRTLEMSGVLEFEKGVHGGAIIRGGSNDGVKQTIKDMVVLGSIPLSHLTEVRACLLGFAVKLAARHGTPADFAAIAANIDETETLLKKPDPIASVPAISEFYILLGCASHNHIMEMLVDSLTEIVRDLLLTIRLKATLDIISPRRRTLACIIAGDGEGAEREIQAHLVELTKFIADRTALDG